MMQNTSSPSTAVSKALLCLMTSALLFSIMGVCIRFASETVDNPTVVFLGMLSDYLFLFLCCLSKV
jgi:hypothetical protein